MPSKVEWELSKLFPKFRRYQVFQRFLRNVDITDLDDCWEWKACSNDGEGRYGSFSWSEKGLKLAHIASYELFVGRRHGLYVCHSCDNPLCVNPSHLWLGTQKQNVADMIKKDRLGDRAKLSTHRVKKIRRMYSSGEYTQKHIAKKFGVDRATISYIVNNKIWNH